MHNIKNKRIAISTPNRSATSLVAEHLFHCRIGHKSTVLETMQKTPENLIALAKACMEKLKKPATPEADIAAIKALIEGFPKNPFAIFHSVGQDLAVWLYPVNGDAQTIYQSLGKANPTEDQWTKAERSITNRFKKEVRIIGRKIATGSNDTLPRHAFRDTQVQRSLFAGVRLKHPGAIRNVVNNLEVLAKSSGLPSLKHFLIKGMFLQNTDDLIMVFQKLKSCFFSPPMNHGQESEIREEQTHLKQELVAAICRDTFGNDPLVLVALAENMDIFEDKAQLKIADYLLNAVNKGWFNPNPSECLKMVEAIPFENSQEWVAEAVDEKNATCGNLLLTLICGFTDPTAKNRVQEKLQRAIENNLFEQKPDVLLGMVRSRSAFTRPALTSQVQHAVTDALTEGIFDHNTDGLETLAQNLGMFTTPLAKKALVFAIKSGQFGDNPNVLKALIENMRLLPEGQGYLSNKVKEMVASPDPAICKAQALIFEALFHSLFFLAARDDGAFRTAQQAIASALEAGRITGSLFLETLSKNLDRFTDVTARNSVENSVKTMKFGIHIPNSPGQVRDIFLYNKVNPFK